MTDDPVARLKAALDEDEAWFHDERSVDDPVGEDLRQRLLRTITAHRRILAEIVPAMNASDDQLEQEFGMQGDPPPPYLSQTLLEILAAIYSDGHTGGGQ